MQETHMFRITASGPRDIVETAWDAVAWADPSPAGAVDAKEDGRSKWVLDAYAETDADVEACLAIIAKVAPSLNPVTKPVANIDWVTKSLEGLPAVDAGRFIVVGSHGLAESSPGKTAVLIEAGPAFGTGHHGTTLGCLIALEKVTRGRRLGKVLDLGTGSGVLAIAALKAGATRAIGTDIDADSVRVANENARKNAAAANFKAITASGVRSASVQAGAPYDTVFANILARPLVRLAPDIQRVTAPGGVIILSGLLTHQIPQVRGAFAGRGLNMIHRIRKDGWATLVFQKLAIKPETAPSKVNDAVEWWLPDLIV